MKKLTSNEILNHLRDGAVLTKVNNVVYKYWVLKLNNGISIFNIRKNAPEKAISVLRKFGELEFFNNNKVEYSFRFNNNKN